MDKVSVVPERKYANLLFEYIDESDVKFIKSIKLNEATFPAIVDLVNYYSKIYDEDISLFLSYEFEEPTLLYEEISIFESIEERYPKFNSIGVLLIFRALFLVYKMIVEPLENIKQDKNETNSYINQKYLMFEQMRKGTFYNPLMDFFSSFSLLVDYQITDTENAFRVKIFFLILNHFFPEYPCVLNNPLIFRGAIVVKIYSDLETLRNAKINFKVTDNGSTDRDNEILKLCVIRDNLLHLYWEDLATNSILDKDQKSIILSSLPQISDKDIILVSNENETTFLMEFIMIDIFLILSGEKYFRDQTLTIALSIIVQSATAQFIKWRSLLTLALKTLCDNDYKTYLISRTETFFFHAKEKNINRIKYFYKYIDILFEKQKQIHENNLIEASKSGDYPFLPFLIESHSFYSQAIKKLQN
ncbi:MAG TPA: hypothetical protein PK771_04215 [Spirochaetota bacterium]|nr:hypothetical protein [Spirochaetota bacterium]